MNKGMNTMNMIGEIGATVAKTKTLPDLQKYAAKLEEANNAVVDLTMTFASLGKSSSFLIPILNASPYLDIFGDMILGHFLLQGAAIAREKLDAIFAAKERRFDRKETGPGPYGSGCGLLRGEDCVGEVLRRRGPVFGKGKM